MTVLRKNRATKTIPHPDQQDFLSALGSDMRPLIEVPAEVVRAPASCDFDSMVRVELKAAITAAPFSREQIAEMLTELTGRTISKPMLDTYTGDSRPNKLPADLLPALRMILGPSLLQAISDAAGCVLLERSEAMLARFGQLQLITIQAKAQQEELINCLPIFAGAKS